ncbi:SGNH/GDSL hydrolase family protein [Hydrogenophaga sp. BPS33]|uniref:SGNH/GDSL hydrolase family protein n=1 Tax=Hydrogenophaga sp. BPS33 TaxID=2651974 RepID=UPI00131FA993|nr:SGNH/GDSL hydrolase family protein [Hydrogenophaga sp. BPS33]QHE85938.1 SGNH/GDSL hydrolase family protein [Hydrogenophaga sp. BPS33]
MPCFGANCHCCCCKAALAVKKLQASSFVLGALCAGGTLALAVWAAATWPGIADGFFWRYERWEARPTLGQRLFERRLLAHQLGQDRLVPEGAVVFLGDSHLQVLPVGALSQAYNFAIGGQSAQRLSERIGRYTSVRQARAVVIGAGSNDLFEGRGPEEVAEAWASLLDQVPASVKVVCVGLPVQGPGTAHRKLQSSANQRIGDMCARRRHEMIDVVPGEGAFADVSFAADGVHLDDQGSRRLLSRIDAVLPKS